MESTARWTSRPRLWVTAWLLAGLLAALGVPSAAQAHGAVDPAAMWYLNQVPARTPPLGLTARTPPRWQHASSAHSYEWHDGRRHALASTARAPGATFIGRWTVPLRVGGVPTAITGGLYYAPNPSPVWLWPMVVVAACVLAALRPRWSSPSRAGRRCGWRVVAGGSCCS
jgi:hypothetical protein